MSPELSLGPLNSPSIEFSREEIYPIVAYILQNAHDLNDDRVDNIRTFIGLDTAYLHRGTEWLFRCLETVCKAILAGEAHPINRYQLKFSEVGSWLTVNMKTDDIPPESKGAAQRYLDFLAAHPDHWPPKFDEASDNA